VSQEVTWKCSLSMTKSYFVLYAFSVEGSNFVSRKVTSEGSLWRALYVRLNGESSPFSRLLVTNKLV
jgi:hypothetical protein